MLEDTINFYNQESSHYTAKRYPQVIQGYTQYIFKRRLSLFLGFLRKVLVTNKTASVLEIGCADGIVFKAIEDTFPSVFHRLLGSDISPGMIAEATANNTNSKAAFCLRSEIPQEQFDFVIELGVHVYDLSKEINQIKINLAPNGFFVYSVAGGKSIFKHFKLKGNKYADNYLPYKSVEQELKKNFDIVHSATYGIFIPKLWKFPVLGRIFQPIIDSFFSRIAPELFHEKLYLLKVR